MPAEGEKKQVVPPPVLGSARLTMWLLMILPWFACHAVRKGLPILIEFICRDLGYNDAQKGQLLGSFFPGYVLAQIPSGVAAKVWGGKAVNTALFYGQGLVVALMPLLAGGGRRGLLGLCGCMSVIGVLQAPLVPGLGPMERAWMPPGPERALSLRIPHLGIRFSFLSALSIPLLATRFGWRVVPYVLSAGSILLGVVWQLWAAETPSEWRKTPAMSVAERKLFGLDPNPAAPAPKKKRAAGLSLATYFVKVPRAWLPVLGHTTGVAIDYALMQWSPTRYLEELGCSPAQMGVHVAIPSAVDIFAQFVTSAIEGAINKAGVPQVKIHKLNALVGSISQAFMLLIFGMTRTPWIATTAVCSFHFASISQHLQCLDSVVLSAGVPESRPRQRHVVFRVAELPRDRRRRRRSPEGLREHGRERARHRAAPNRRARPVSVELAPRVLGDRRLLPCLLRSRLLQLPEHEDSRGTLSREVWQGPGMKSAQSSICGQCVTPWLPAQRAWRPPSQPPPPPPGAAPSPSSCRDPRPALSPSAPGPRHPARNGSCASHRSGSAAARRRRCRCSRRGAWEGGAAAGRLRCGWSEGTDAC